jgi:hypothetical protein
MPSFFGSTRLFRPYVGVRPALLGHLRQSMTYYRSGSSGYPWAPVWWHHIQLVLSTDRSVHRRTEDNSALRTGLLFQYRDRVLHRDGRRPPRMWLGAFAASVVLRDWTMWGMDRGDAGGWLTQMFFWVMGGGCAAKYVSSQAVGRQVGGAFGWVWTPGVAHYSSMRISG